MSPFLFFVKKGASAGFSRARLVFQDQAARGVRKFLSKEREDPTNYQRDSSLPLCVEGNKSPLWEDAYILCRQELENLFSG